MIAKIKKAGVFLLSFFRKHKIISLIIIVALLGVGYWLYKSSTNTNGVTRYVLAEATKGTIISSVTGTGQTSATTELDIKPKTSGDLTYVAIASGQTINKGQLIAKIDATDAQQAADNAQKALNQAKTELEKMKGVQTSLGTLRGVTEKAQDDLDATYESGFNTVTNAFLNLPTIMTGLQDILFSSTFNSYQQNIDYYASGATAYNQNNIIYKTSAETSYNASRLAYDANFIDFKKVNRTSSKTEIESLIRESYDTIGKISQSLKDSVNLIQSYQDELTQHNIRVNSTSNTHLSSLSGYINTTNNYLSSLLSTETNIETNKETLIQTSYDIADQESLVAEKQTALDDANKNLWYCSIYAPFSGIISAVNVKTGDSVSTGTALAKIVTKDVIAKVSLNEVDASKIKIGQKVTTTFDAINGLTITGVVYSIDTIGTVSQGVVSYTAQINFDTQNSTLKPGMSVSSTIITDSKMDVLTIPNSAVKSKNGSYYVLIPGSPAPTQKTVEIGIADDTNTEITGGLAEGDQVVARTISGVKTTTTGTTQGLFGAGGRPGN